MLLMIAVVPNMGVQTVSAGVKAAGTSGFDGKWTSIVKHPALGDLNYTYTFKVDGNKVTGIAATQSYSSNITDGKVEGNTIIFVEPVELVGQVWPIRHTGTLSGDTIKFIRQCKDEAAVESEAARAK